MNALAQLICSRVRAEIFRLLFGPDADELHLRELQRRSGFALGTVRQDVEKLVEMGLVIRRQDGNRIYYAANREHPLYPDIRQMVVKTVGLTDILREALCVPEMRCAFVFGSIASESATPTSDVDLMVIGELSLRDVANLLTGVGHRLGREINPHVLSPSEFAKRVIKSDHFLTSVMASPKVFVVGTAHDLEAMA